MSPVNAQEWARRSDESSLRISELERVVFRAHPEVLAALEVDRAGAGADASRQAYPGSGRWSIIGMFVILLAPMAGVSTYSLGPATNFERIDASIAIPITGVCFVITLIAQGLAAIMWISQGAVWDGAILFYGAMSAVLGWFATIAIPRIALKDGVAPGTWYWSVPTAAVVGVLLAAAVWSRRSTHERATGFQLVEQTVSALSERKREELRRDRNAALRILHERGVLGDVRVQVAEGADLGALERLELVWKARDAHSQREAEKNRSR